jgi:hypothetical protein
MMKNWRTIVKIVVAVLTALLGTVGATLSDGVAPFWLDKPRCIALLALSYLGWGAGG